MDRIPDFVRGHREIESRCHCTLREHYGVQTEESSLLDQLLSLLEVVAHLWLMKAQVGRSIPLITTESELFPQRLISANLARRTLAVKDVRSTLTLVSISVTKQIGALIGTG